MKTKICTDIEQSKKLIELGIDPKTADMNWHSLPNIEPFSRTFPYIHENGATEGILPAWSLSALLELMPYCRIETYAGGFFSTYYCSHGAMNEVNHFEKCKTPVDAAFEMVCWLKENEKI